MTQSHDENQKRLMAEAIALSFEAMHTGRGGPYGAVVVKDGEIIGRGMNRVLTDHDPTAHAELLAIQAACRALSSFSLEGCELYTSCEPCPMCLGAIYWAKLDRVYFANSVADAETYGFGSRSRNIYEEVGRPLATRSLSMTQFMRDEAAVAFQEWANKSDKTSY
ncbi:MAG: nucleoside deaminase [Synechococcales bacterium]|nr:nucleoside deaminase [Synechococcales bacterium]